MKYARDRKITSSHTAEVLIEAFPWIKNATGKTILIKYGGAAMVDPRAAQRRDERYRHAEDHGRQSRYRSWWRCPAINKNMDKFGIDVEFKDGRALLLTKPWTL